MTKALLFSRAFFWCLTDRKNLNFRAFINEDTELYLSWAELDHVKNTWFLDGYQPKEAIYKTVEEIGYNFPFLILSDRTPIFSYFEKYKMSASPPHSYFRSTA